MPDRGLDTDTGLDATRHPEPEIRNRSNYLLMIAILIAAVDIGFLLFGFRFNKQILIAFGTCVFALAVFLLVFHLKSLGEKQEVVRKVISVSAWVMILQILLLAIGLPWSKSGIILCFFAIALFGAAVVNGWGADVEWVKQYAIRFAVVLFILCMIFILFGANVSFKSIGRAWSNLRTSHSEHINNRRLEENLVSQKQELADAQKQLDALKQEPKQEIDEPAIKAKLVAPNRKAIFDSNYWRAKKELEAWRAQVDSL